MSSTANQEIRAACQAKKVPLWRVAESLKIADTTLSKRLRRPLPNRKKEEILGIIEQLGKEVKEDES